MFWQRKRARRAKQETIDRAQRLFRDDRLGEGVEFLEPAVKRYPKDPELRLLYGTVLTFVRPEDAWWQLATAIKFDTKHPRRLVRAAQMMFYLGEVEVAESYVARVRQLAPAGEPIDPSVVNLEGLIAVFRGDRVLADKRLRAAANADPHNRHFALDLARFLASTDRVAEAHAVLDRALGLRPYDQDLRDLQKELADPQPSREQRD